MSTDEGQEWGEVFWESVRTGVVLGSREKGKLVLTRPLSGPKERTAVRVSSKCLVWVQVLEPPGPPSMARGSPRSPSTAG